MPLIYKPTGLALEYIPDGYALNIYLDCTFGCTYCYNRFHTNKESNPRHNLVVKLLSEIDQYAGKKIFIQFLADPYQPEEHDYHLTRKVIQLFYNHGIIPVLLTKGMPEDEDWDLFKAFKEFHFGTTLTSLMKNEYEPNAPDPADRILNLFKAKREYGLTTWVSLEPVIYPDSVIEIIELTNAFVDYYRIGAWNYSSEAHQINYPAFLDKLKLIPDSIQQKIYIKTSFDKFS